MLDGQNSDDDYDDNNDIVTVARILMISPLYYPSNFVLPCQIVVVHSAIDG